MGSRSSSASRSSTGLMRSESPAAGRESPAKQGVNFRAQPNVKTYEKEEEEEERVMRSVDSSTDPPTFDWVEITSSEGQTKGKIQSNGGQAKEESKKVERIVPIILNGREEGRSRSRERAPNPFLSGSKAVSEPGLKSNQEQEKISNGASSSPTKIAPLATAET